MGLIYHECMRCRGSWQNAVKRPAKCPRCLSRKWRTYPEKVFDMETNTVTPAWKGKDGLLVLGKERRMKTSDYPW